MPESPISERIFFFIGLNIISTPNDESFFLSIPKKERVKLSLSLGYEENILTHEYL